ncbi:MAG: DNA internalization-related competence protein ComEC/Rec2 [Deltaproteobacteria bacterium]|nr:DNA internalization-related competence protein ComEC/Rec2 [Deltaproteobacteria bacterium]
MQIPGFSRPLVPLLLSLIAGILIGNNFREFGTWAIIVVCAGAGISLFSAIFKRNIPVGLIIFFIGLGYLLIHPWVAPNFPEHHIFRFAGNKFQTITGTILTLPVKRGYGTTFILESQTVTSGDVIKTVVGKIRVSVSGKAAKLECGDRISFRGRIQPVRSFRNPGGFDYRRYMAFKGVWVTTYARATHLVVMGHEPLSGLERLAGPARKRLAQRIDGVQDQDAAAVLKALILGDRRGIVPDTWTIFQRAGIGHLLAISGLHIGTVATTVFFLLSHLLGFIPPLLTLAWTRRGAAFFAIGAIWAYGILAGMSPSTQRAVVMGTVFLMTFFVGRPADTVNFIAVAALVILILHPPALFSISFQLSFSAVISIVWGLHHFPPASKERYDSRWRAAMRWCLGFMSVSLFAIVGTLPLTMYYFNQVSLIGVASNLVFIPLIGFGVVPLGLLSALVSMVSPYLGTVGFAAAGLILSHAISWADWVASWPFAAVKTVSPSLIEICLFYAILGFMPELFRSATRIRRRPAAVICLVFVIAVSADIFYWCQQRFWNDDLRVTVLDVGHGNCVLVEMPGGQPILIDGGGFSDNAVFDVGQRIVAPYLWRRKIRTLGTVVLSHPNSDHLNGLIYILQNFHVNRVVTNGETSATRGYVEFIAAIEKNAVHMPGFTSMNRDYADNGVSIKLLYPPPDFLSRSKTEKWRDSNTNSIVLRVSFGDIAFLVPGDITAVGEKELIGLAGTDLRSDVLVAPHHGSKTSSSWEFLQQVAPKIVIVSSAWRARHQFPHPKVLDRYRRTGARVYRTHDLGAITFTTDGRELSVKHMKACS